MQRLAPIQKILERLRDRMVQNLKPDGWSIKIWGEGAALFSAVSAETHDLEPLVLAVYWTCRGNPCSTPDSMTAIPAVLQGVSLTFWFSEWVDESLDRPHLTGLLHAT